MHRIAAPLAIALSISACTQDAPAPQTEPRQSAGAKVAAPSSPDPSAAPSPDASAPGRQHRYTSLKDCKVVKQERAEMPYTETECRGLGYFTLRIADSDARQRMTLVPPSSEAVELPLARIGGGAFSGFGETAEWRGPAATPFEPDSLIVRFDVAEQPYPAPETSYLLVARLGRDPCLVAVVPPGKGQNDSARAKADASGACLSG